MIYFWGSYLLREINSNVSKKWVKFICNKQFICYDWINIFEKQWEWCFSLSLIQYFINSFPGTPDIIFKFAKDSMIIISFGKSNTLFKNIVGIKVYFLYVKLYGIGMSN